MTQLPLALSPFSAELQERIADARASEISDCARAVLDILANSSEPHLGRAKAIQISAMQRIWARSGCYVWPERSVKGAAKELIEEHEVPVGSSRCAGSAGYYLISTAEDAEAAERPLRAEIISLAIRIKAINPKSRYGRHLLGQLEVETEI